MPTAPGFADVSVAIAHVTMSRLAYITFGVDPTDTDPLLVADDVITALGASGSLASKFDTQITLPSVRVSLGTDGGEDIVGVRSSTLTGGTTQTSPPANCAVLVHKATARGGRRGRGRMFIPWFCGEDQVGENGQIDPVQVTPLQNCVTIFLSMLATNGVPMVLLHRVSAPGTAHPSTPGSPNTVSSLRVDTLISTQRRRLGR